MDQQQTAVTTTTTAGGGCGQTDDDDVDDKQPLSSLSLTASSSSRLTELMDNHLQQWRRVEDLERRLDEFCIRQRRRVANLLEQTPTYRRSHLRLFVTHQYEQNNNNNNKPIEQQQLLPQWTLVIEGKLLVGHLDHQSMAQVEEAALQKATKESGWTNTTATTTTTTATTAYTATATTTNTSTNSNDPTPLTPLARSTDRSQYRSVGEREEDPVEAIRFTHFFDRVHVDFQTVFQPVQQVPSVTAPLSASSPPPSTTLLKKTTLSKKPRSKRKQASAAAAAAAMSELEDTQRPTIDPALLTSSPITTLQWTKTSSQTDAHAFFLRYPQPRPIHPHLTIHSVVATITLFPSLPEDGTLYKPSAALANALFPKHVPPVYSPATGVHSKKRKLNDGGSGDAMDVVAVTERPIPLEHDSIVPATLSWNEIASALAQYVTEKKLQDEADKSIIQNDSILRNLFQCETMNFSELKQLLLSRNLISLVNHDNDDPFVITYIMTEQTASPTLSLVGSVTAKSIASSEAVPPAVPLLPPPQPLSFDMDVYVPSLFPYRARELLRRIKKREFEYTSSRTKARYLLVASNNKSNEEAVKAKMEQAVCGKGGVTMEHIPVFLALAKSSPPLSEARAAAQIDARLCALLEKFQQRYHAAQTAWDLVDTMMCRNNGQQQQPPAQQEQQQHQNDNQDSK